MIIRLAFIALTLTFPNGVAAQSLPASVDKVIQHSNADASTKAAISANWPALDLEEVIANWSKEKSHPISDDARASLIVDALIEEQRAVEQFTAKPEDVRESAKRAILSFLYEEIDNPSVTSIGAFLDRDLGHYPELVKKENNLGTLQFETQTSGAITNSTGDTVVEFDGVYGVTLAPGDYQLKVEKDGQPCEASFSLPAGPSKAPTCPR